MGIEYKTKNYGPFTVNGVTYQDWRVERYISGHLDRVFDDGWTKRQAEATKRELVKSFHLDL